MPVFDFSNTMSEKKEEGACTYTVRYSGGDAATVERPILLLDHKTRQWKHHSGGFFTNQNVRTAFEFKEEDGTFCSDILEIDARFVNAKPVQCSQSLIAHHHSHIIFLLKIHQTAAFFPKFFSNNTSLTVSIILRKIMAQKPLPVSLKRIMDRMPVPVHHTVGPGCQMTVGTTSGKSLMIA